MSVNLIDEIDAFLEEFGIGDHRFGMLATKNGRLLERLRAGGRLYPDVERKIRDFMRDERDRRQSIQSRRKSNRAEAAA
jgi:CHASE3 domain sensor protein